MKNLKGFYLTETIIYIALSSLFFILLFQFTNQMYKKYKSSGSNLNSQSWSVMDLIAKDLQKTNQILAIEMNKIIITTAKPDICWELIKNNLYRIEGKYNPSSVLAKATSDMSPTASSGTLSLWVNPIKSLVHYNISMISFKKDRQCVSIELEIKQGIKILNFKRDVFIRNRDL